MIGPFRTRSSIFFKNLDTTVSILRVVLLSFRFTKQNDSLFKVATSNTIEYCDCLYVFTSNLLFIQTLSTLTLTSISSLEMLVPKHVH